MKMRDYELEVCEALQHDIFELGGDEWDLDTVYNFWSEWSEMLAAGWLSYEKGDLETLKMAIEHIGEA